MKQMGQVPTNTGMKLSRSFDLRFLSTLAAASMIVLPTMLLSEEGVGVKL
jgi:hypothetical protein